MHVAVLCYEQALLRLLSIMFQTEAGGQRNNGVGVGVGVWGG